ncbi:hypothetical protein Back2_00010 [Nocardioides baekrokdamisoli]|uniref:DUF3817 domain-containing protein n=1 Tax=Nocardioides baekrokdamisoli TaxID=1804624 RepID=A0A3G9IX22_9ACTN|nr:DUF3817 domain-containing protein [Nocardioides baekrokdamisoli]BBH15714.1 hypothetical protein Back2_00010 [Nocardioides baekrokdamisoli]
MSFLSRPLDLFRRIAIAEAITWALLLTGMFLKYVTHTTELGVKVFGMIHGVVFISYVVTTVTVWVDQKWTLRRGIGALLASIPPFVTIVVELLAVRRGWIGASWRLRTSADAGLSRPESLVRWVLVAPVRGLAVALVAVVVLTGVALLVGPPASS